jgi:hypothetical protein
VTIPSVNDIESSDPLDHPTIIGLVGLPAVDVGPANLRNRLTAAIFSAENQ